MATKRPPSHRRASAEATCRKAASAIGRSTFAIAENGGKVLGSVKHPLGTADFASLLLQAQASKAKVLAIASPGASASRSTATTRKPDSRARSIACR